MQNFIKRIKLKPFLSMVCTESHFVYAHRKACRFLLYLSDFNQNCNVEQFLAKLTNIKLVWDTPYLSHAVLYIRTDLQADRAHE
jgi:hypothetical protein